MSRFPDVAAVATLLLAASATARSQAVLDVSGSVVSVGPRLEVRVEVTNRGDRPAAPIDRTRGEKRSGKRMLSDRSRTRRSSRLCTTGPAMQVQAAKSTPAMASTA